MSYPPTTFERFEYKYWVTEPIAAELLRIATPFLRRDGLATGGQRNTSLYLDSPDLDFFRSHTESSPDRLKLRVRAYGDPPAGSAFFEIKRKVKAVSLKRRAVVPMDAVASLLGAPGVGPAPPLQLRSAQEEATLSHFLYLMAVHQAEPRALLTCRREAFSGTEAEDGVRLTLDRDICYQSTSAPSLHGDPRAWIPLCGMGTYQPDAAVLVEVKFRGLAPLWLEELIARLSLCACAYSKYVSAMARDELGPLVCDALDLTPTAAGWARRAGKGG